MRFRPIVFSAACLLCLAGCRTTSSPIVGTWLVKAPEAPFAYHMFIFHSDGTMQQSNPDAGDRNTSDSSGLGVWTQGADGIRGKFVEVMADRTTHQFVSRGEISFVVQVSGDVLKGTASAVFFDAEGRRLREPVAATLSGQRILP
jgi:hypothetical protein